ncbi:MAG: hypothetical protein WDA06_06490 [Phenylobacterium sp.]
MKEEIVQLLMGYKSLIQYHAIPPDHICSSPDACCDCICVDYGRDMDEVAKINKIIKELENNNAID